MGAKHAILRLAAAACVGMAALAVQAADLRVAIDLSEQEMTVTRADGAVHVWPVSTARAGKCTPVGTFHPVTLKRMHYSTLYDGAPMPFSIFFSGNYAIHGTTETDRLGAPASAGCVRLAPENAETLFEAVLAAGKSETEIVIHE